MFEVETGVKGAYRINRRLFDDEASANAFAARWRSSNSTGEYWAEVTDLGEAGRARVIAGVWFRPFGCECGETLWDSLDCLLHGEENNAAAAAEQAAEIDAENAWLRAAEAPSMDDLAFEAHEAAMGLV